MISRDIVKEFSYAKFFDMLEIKKNLEKLKNLKLQITKFNKHKFTSSLNHMLCTHPKATKMLKFYIFNPYTHT